MVSQTIQELPPAEWEAQELSPATVHRAVEGLKEELGRGLKKQNGLGSEAVQLNAHFEVI